MHVGKWHCGDQPEFLPTRHGFDHYFGIPFSNDMGRHQNREKQYPSLPLLYDEEVAEEQPEQEGLTERYVEHAIRFMRENRKQPFFLYLAHLHVHRPVLVSRRFAERAQNGRYGAAVECIDWAAPAPRTTRFSTTSATTWRPSGPANGNSMSASGTEK